MQHTAFIWAKTNINLELTTIDNIIDDNCLKTNPVILLLNLSQINHQLIELLLIHQARSTQHHITTLVVLWERDTVADAVQTSEQAHEAI